MKRRMQEWRHSTRFENAAREHRRGAELIAPFVGEDTPHISEAIYHWEGELIRTINLGELNRAREIAANPPEDSEYVRILVELLADDLAGSGRRSF